MTAPSGNLTASGVAFASQPTNISKASARRAQLCMATALSRITVLDVSGVANAPSEVGSTIRDHFDCRAYFVDSRLVDTLVVFDHGH